MRYDYSKLIELIYKKRLTQEKVAKYLNIRKSAFSLKVNNHVGFSQDDIVKISEYLGIPKTKIYEYFFTEKV